MSTSQSFLGANALLRTRWTCPSGHCLHKGTCAEEGCSLLASNSQPQSSLRGPPLAQVSAVGALSAYERSQCIGHFSAMVTASKTAVRKHRGFESLPLRQRSPITRASLFPAGLLRTAGQCIGCQPPRSEASTKSRRISVCPTPRPSFPHLQLTAHASRKMSGKKRTMVSTNWAPSIALC
jgi:hypothetical protein